MKRIVLFRFHKHIPICRNKLQLLKLFNPDIEIYGLFGGRKSEVLRFEKAFENELRHVYYVRRKNVWWKAFSFDIAMRYWFNDYGHKIDFDVLHIIEWDILLFNSLDKIYKNIPTSKIALTALVPMNQIWGRWWWTKMEPWWIEQWGQLMDYVRDKYQYKKMPYASLGPGACFPREFIEKFSQIEVPELCHDEVRLPLFAQALGFSLCNTKFRTKWFNPEEGKYFHCDKRQIKYELIKEELLKPNGRRVFHPYQSIIKIDEIQKILRLKDD